MFNWFKKTSEKDKLQARYRKLLGEAHKLSQVNRSKGDAKYAEAEAVLQQLKTLEQAS